MLRVKSFDIKDAAGINELLEKYNLAKEAHILISNGSLCVPYEDGEAPNTAQRIISIKEQKNLSFIQLDLLIHSQLVLEIQAKGIKAEIEKLEASLITTGGKKKDYDNNKKIEEEKKRLSDVLKQTENQMIQNQAEITRLNTNVAVFDQRLNEIANGK